MCCSFFFFLLSDPKGLTSLVFTCGAKQNRLRLNIFRRQNFLTVLITSNSAFKFLFLAVLLRIHDTPFSVVLFLFFLLCCYLCFDTWVAKIFMSAPQHYISLRFASVVRRVPSTTLFKTWHSLSRTGLCPIQLPAAISANTTENRLLNYTSCVWVYVFVTIRVFASILKCSVCHVSYECQDVFLNFPLIKCYFLFI